MRRIVLAAFALTVLAACQPVTTELTEEQKAEITAEVNLEMDQLWDDLVQPDWDRLAEYFHQSPDFVMGSDGMAIFGYEAVENAFQPLVDTWERQILTVSDTKTLVLATDMAYSMRVGTDAMVLKSGETTPTQLWAMSFVWVRRDGEWRTLAGHQSHSELPQDAPDL